MEADDIGLFQMALTLLWEQNHFTLTRQWTHCIQKFSASSSPVSIRKRLIFFKSNYFFNKN